MEGKNRNTQEFKTHLEDIVLDNKKTESDLISHIKILTKMNQEL